MAKLERYLSRRLLFSGERKALVAAITFIAISGVAVGVAALVIVLGVMDGATRDLFGKMIEIYPHVRVFDREGEQLEDPARIVAVAREMPGVRAAEAVISKKALFAGALGARSEAVAGLVFGVDDINDSDLYPVRNVEAGEPITLGDREILLGAPLAEKLKLGPGDSVLLITALAARSANRQSPSHSLTVSGIVETGYYTFDSNASFVTVETAKDVFGQGEAADFVYVKIDDPMKANDFAGRLANAILPTGINGPVSLFSSPYRVSTWEDESGWFFESLKLQKAALFLILMLIVLVAGLNIIGTLILMVLDKTREIGILKAMGASNRTIRGTFVGVGVTIGVVGTGAGVAIGLVGCFLLHYMIRLEMPAAVYDFDRLPVHVDVGTVAIIVLSANAMCFFSALIPSAMAARLDPVEALRHE